YLSCLGFTFLFVRTLCFTWKDYPPLPTLHRPVETNFENKIDAVKKNKVQNCRGTVEQTYYMDIEVKLQVEIKKQEWIDEMLTRDGCHFVKTECRISIAEVVDGDLFNNVKMNVVFSIEYKRTKIIILLKMYMEGKFIQRHYENTKLC
ncbi:hypothetical protein L9F63_012616, partial [Diploptera punctata]